MSLARTLCDRCPAIGASTSEVCIQSRRGYLPLTGISTRGLLQAFVDDRVGTPTCASTHIFSSRGKPVRRSSQKLSVFIMLHRHLPHFSMQMLRHRCITLPANCPVLIFCIGSRYQGNWRVWGLHRTSSLPPSSSPLKRSCSRSLPPLCTSRSYLRGRFPFPFCFL